MRTEKRLAGGFALALAASVSSFAAITGQWDFNNATTPLNGSVGEPITYLDGPGGATEGQTQFGTTQTFGIPAINGTSATVMKFGTNGFSKGYAVPHGIAENGGGVNVNHWSIIMDVLFPASSSGKWRALLQTYVDNPENDDAELYIDESNGVGINSSYHGNVAGDTWVRLAFVAEGNAENQSLVLRKYINGIKVGENTGTLDGRFALTPSSTAVLFTDGYATDIYTQPGYINSLQIHDEALSDAYIAALGSPTAAGITTQVQTKPFVTSLSPAAGTGASPAKAFSATIENGVTRLNTNSVRLSLNDTAVTPVINTNATGATISYNESGLFAPLSTNVWQLIFADNAATPNFSTNTVQIVVNNYATMTLPQPLYFEDFETTAEGSLPTGWTNLSFTEITRDEEDLTDLSSASFARWIVIDSDRFQGSFTTYSEPANPTEWEEDYQRVLNYTPSYVINGELVTELAEGKFVFGNSGYRNGASQVLDLYSPDFNLAGKTNVYLVFNSIWEQNQDSLAGVEYSTDEGQTWKPVVYYLDRGDVIRTNGVIDVTTTLTTNYNDVARYFDADGVEQGGFFGAFVKAPIDESLAAHISGRIDDNTFDSKRVEMFRLPAADNQANVRFRFFHAGTDSWYFGVDNFGLYSIELEPAGPTLTATRNGETLTISWTGATGGRLQRTTSLSSLNWQDVSVPAGATSVNEPITGTMAFYRWVQP
ncbi:MAG TPA: hypothetical protein VF773_06580 [Verrucomicrobiae bacterium]